jgi:hypothetical protein
MLQYSERSELFNQILLLQGNNPETAKTSLKNFTDTYSLAECRSFLWTMVETCLTTDDFSFSEPSDRTDLLARNRDFQELFEAVYVLAESWTIQQKNAK